MARVVEVLFPEEEHLVFQQRGPDVRDGRIVEFLVEPDPVHLGADISRHAFDRDVFRGGLGDVSCHLVHSPSWVRWMCGGVWCLAWMSGGLGSRAACQRRTWHGFGRWSAAPRMRARYRAAGTGRGPGLLVAEWDERRAGDCLGHEAVRSDWAVAEDGHPVERPVVAGVAEVGRREVGGGPVVPECDVARLPAEPHRVLRPGDLVVEQLQDAAALGG